MVMKFIDWFAGIGGFRRGLEMCGHECVGFCEFDKFAVASYTSMHLITEEQRAYLVTLDLKARQKEILKEEYRNGEWYASEVRTVDARSLPEADIWCFGFPCQDISVAGKRLGFTGNRSSLFFRIMYILGQLEEEKKPAYLFIENVKNLLSVNGGWDFARLLVELDRGGYDAEWQVLNSKYFGVPQNRERCFIIGHLRGRSTAEVFPVEGTDAADCIHGVGHRKGYRRNTQIFDPEGITEALDTGAGGGRGHYTIEVIGHASHDENQPKVAIPVLTPDRAQTRQNGRRFKEDGEESFTLTSQDRHGVAVEVKIGKISGAFGIDKGYKPQERDIANYIESREDRGLSRRKQEGTLICHKIITDASCNHGIFVKMSEDLTVYAVWYPKKQCYIAIRKLTPKECFRLQGWMDDYFEKAQFVNSDSQLYKQAGNGVTVNVIKAIGEKMSAGQ